MVFCARTKSQCRSRLASQLLVCMDELARWRAAGLGAGSIGGGREQYSNLARGDGIGEGDATDGGGEPPAAFREGEGKRSTPPERVAVGGGANVMVLAATNAPEAVDAAFLRPGRFDEVKMC